MIPFYESWDRARIFAGKDLQFPPHLHRQMELLYVRRGTLNVSIGRESRLLREGDLALIYPNQVHGYAACGRSDTIVAICDPDLCGSWRHSAVTHHPADPFVPGALVHGDIPFAMGSLLEESSRALQEEQAPGSELCAAYVQLILARCLPLVTLRRNDSARSADLIHRVIQYISEQYRQPLCLEQLAEELGASKYRLSRIFSGELHTTFTAYLDSFRLELARSLLSGSDLPVLQICFECGYDSQRTFNRAFKRETGLSPREYRNRCARAADRGQSPPIRL